MPAKVGRPPHVPTEALRKQVEAMASFGVPQDAIADVLGIAIRTLTNHYKATIRTASTKANAMVAQSLFNKAIGTGPGSVEAAKFWLRTRAGWSENPSGPADGDDYASKFPGKKAAAINAANELVSRPSSEWGEDLMKPPVRTN